MVHQIPILPKKIKEGYSTHELAKFVEFPYSSGCTCCTKFARLNTSISSLMTSREEYEKALVSYLQEVGIEYEKGIARSIRQIAGKLAELNNPSLQQVNDIIVFNLLNNWQNNFTKNIRKIIQRNIDKSYRFFRQDRNVFQGNINDAPNSVLDLQDFRTMEYFSELDEVYLGKFITDTDTRRRLTRFIEAQHLSGSFSRRDLGPFRAEFKDLLEGEDWKISRIIATTTNKMRGYASVKYINQAEVEEFERVEVNDRLTCPWCRELDGTRYQVSKELTRIEKEINGDPNIVSSVSPFGTALFKDPSDIRNLSNDQLQDLNLGSGPVHPNCRGRIIAVL